MIMLKLCADVLFATNTDCCSSFQAMAGLIMYTGEGTKFNACCDFTVKIVNNQCVSCAACSLELLVGIAFNL